MHVLIKTKQKTKKAALLPEPSLVETTIPVPKVNDKRTSQLVVNSQPDYDLNMSDVRTQRRKRRDAAYAVLRDKPHRDGETQFACWERYTVSLRRPRVLVIVKQCTHCNQIGEMWCI